MPSIVLNGFGSRSTVLHGFGGAAAATPPITSDPFEYGLVTYLSTALGQRIYPYRFAQKLGITYPRILYSLINDGRDLLLKQPSGVVTGKYQISVFALKDNEAVLLRDRLRLALNGYHGLLGNTTVLNCTVRNNPGTWTAGVSESDTGTYSQSSDFCFTYFEQVPTFN